MLSTTYFNKLLFIYKMEGKNMSIQISFVNYCVFNKWFCNTHNDIVSAQIVEGMDDDNFFSFILNKKSGTL